jgi:molybdopterin-binding protein
VPREASRASESDQATVWRRNEAQRPQPTVRHETSINQSDAIANLALDVAGQRLVASITAEAVRDLGLNEGSPITAIIKASDLIITTGG